MDAMNLVFIGIKVDRVALACSSGSSRGFNCCPKRGTESKWRQPVLNTSGRGLRAKPFGALGRCLASSFRHRVGCVSWCSPKASASLQSKSVDWHLQQWLSLAQSAVSHKPAAFGTYVTCSQLLWRQPLGSQPVERHGRQLILERSCSPA